VQGHRLSARAPACARGAARAGLRATAQRSGSVLPAHCSLCVELRGGVHGGAARDCSPCLWPDSALPPRLSHVAWGSCFPTCNFRGPEIMQAEPTGSDAQARLAHPNSAGFKTLGAYPYLRRALAPDRSSASSSLPATVAMGARAHAGPL
jgi:hypothetical protein